MSDQQFRELLAPCLARVQAVAAKRPDIKNSDCRFSVTIGGDGKFWFTATIFHNDNNGCISAYEPTVERAITRLAERLADIPAPPSRAELIAKKRAELAALEGEES
jgi:hypothetical protein